MKTIITCTIFICSFFYLEAQDDLLALHTPKSSSSDIEIMDRTASFPGGNQVLKAFIKDYFKYSEEARSVQYDGKITVFMKIATSGEVVAYRANGAISHGLSKSIGELIQIMPHWKPALENGTPKETVVKFVMDLSVEG